MHHSNKKPTFKAIAVVVLTAFISTSILPPRLGYAQIAPLLNLPLPGTMVTPSAGFVPTRLMGMTVHPENPLQFDFIVDSGNSGLDSESIKAESEKLVKYFLAALTVPKDDLWVNLSPHEHDSMVSDYLGKTILGRDMLAQDYYLKQLTASLIHPDTELGEKFWRRVKKLTFERFGTTNIPMESFNKVWVLPEAAQVYEYQNTVYITYARLKVMTDNDYVAAKADTRQQTQDTSEQQDLETDILREIIIPEIEKEVNEGQNFAPLRQIYYSLILAKWYKETIKDSLLSQIYIDKNKVQGVNVDDETIKEQIYEQYIEAYKKGVFSFIKEDYDALSKDLIPRKYFSGGLNFKGDTAIKRDHAMVNDDAVGDRYVVKMEVVAQAEEIADEAMADDIDGEQGKLFTTAKGSNVSLFSPWWVWHYGDIRENNKLLASFKSQESLDNFDGSGLSGSPLQRKEKAVILQEAVAAFRNSTIGRTLLGEGRAEFNIELRIALNIPVGEKADKQKNVSGKISKEGETLVITLEEALLGLGSKQIKSTSGSMVDTHDALVALVQSHLYQLAIAHQLNQSANGKISEVDRLAFYVLKQLEFIYKHPKRDELIAVLESMPRLGSPFVTVLKDYRDKKLKGIVYEERVANEEINIVNGYLERMFEDLEVNGVGEDKTEDASPRLFQYDRLKEKQSFVMLLQSLGDYYFKKGNYAFALRQYSHGLFYSPHNERLRRKVIETVNVSVRTISDEDSRDFQRIWNEPSSKVSEMWDKVRELTLIGELGYLPESLRPDGTVGTRLDQVEEAVTFLNYLDSIAIAFNPSVEESDFYNYLNNKRLQADPLKEAPVSRFIDTYRSVAKDDNTRKNDATKKILRLAAILLQYSRVLHGDESLDAWHILPRLLLKLGLKPDEREQIMALTSLHRNFGTLYFGEGSPSFTSHYLDQVSARLKRIEEAIGQEGTDGKSAKEKGQDASGGAVSYFEVLDDPELKVHFLQALDAENVHQALDNLRYGKDRNGLEIAGGRGLFDLMPFMGKLGDRDGKYFKSPGVTIFDHTMDLVRFLSLVELGDNQAFSAINHGKQGRLIKREVFDELHTRLHQWIGQEEPSRTKRRRILYMAALFHDSGEYGRGRSELHEEKSADFIHQIFEQLKIIQSQDNDHPEHFNESDVALARWLVLSHVDLGTIRFGERTIHKLYANSYRPADQSPTERADWVRALSFINAADVFGTRQGLNLNQDHFDYFMGIIRSDDYLESQYGRGLFARRLKIFSSDGPGELDRPKFKRVMEILETIKQQYPADFERIEHNFGDPQRFQVLDYAIFFMQSLRAEDMVKLMYLLSVVADEIERKGTHFSTIKFTAPSNLAPFSADPINEIMKNYSLPQIHEFAARARWSFEGNGNGEDSIRQHLQRNANLLLELRQGRQGETILMIDNKRLADLNRYIKLASIGAAAWLLSKARNVTTDNHMESLVFLHSLTKLPIYRELERDWSKIRLFLGLLGEGRMAINLETASKLFQGLTLLQSVQLLVFYNKHEAKLKKLEINIRKSGETDSQKREEVISAIRSWKGGEEFLKEIGDDKVLFATLKRLTRDNEVTKTVKEVSIELEEVQDELYLIRNVSEESLVGFEEFMSRVNIKNGIWNLRSFSTQPTHKRSVLRLLYILYRLSSHYEQKEGNQNYQINVLKFSHELDIGSGGSSNVIQNILRGLQDLPPEKMEEIVQNASSLDPLMAVNGKLHLKGRGIAIETDDNNWGFVDTMFIDLRSEAEIKQFEGLDADFAELSSETKTASDAAMISYNGANVDVEHSWLTLSQNDASIVKTNEFNEALDEAIRMIRPQVIPEVYIIGDNTDKETFGAIYSPQNKRIYIQKGLVERINAANNHAGMKTRIFINLFTKGDIVDKRKAEYEYAKKKHKQIVAQLLPQDRAKGQTFDDIVENLRRNILGIDVSLDQIKALGLSREIKYHNLDNLTFITHAEEFLAIGEDALFKIAINALNKKIDLHKIFRIKNDDPPASPGVKAGMLAFASNPVTLAHYLVATLKAMADSEVDTFFVSPTKGDFRKSALEATYEQRFFMAHEFLESVTGGLIRVMPALEEERPKGKGINGEEKVLPLLEMNKEAEDLTLLYGAGADHYFSFARTENHQVKFAEIDQNNKKDFDYYVRLNAYPQLLRMLLEKESKAVPDDHRAFIELLAKTEDARERSAMVKDKAFFPVLDTIGKLYLIKQQAQGTANIGMIYITRGDQPEDKLRDLLGVDIFYNQGASFDISATKLRLGITRLIRDGIFDANLLEGMPMDLLEELLKPENREYFYSLIRIKGLKFIDAVELPNSVDVLFPAYPDQEEVRQSKIKAELLAELSQIDGGLKFHAGREDNRNTSYVAVTDKSNNEILWHEYSVKNAINDHSGGDNTVLTKNLRSSGSSLSYHDRWRVIKAVEKFIKQLNGSKEKLDSKELSDARLLIEKFPALIARDKTEQELSPDDVDVIMIPGNDDILVFEKVLDLMSRGIGRHLLISGGIGRLTEPLKKMAASEGFVIEAAPEAVMIRDIMIKMAQTRSQWQPLVEILQDPERTLLETKAAYTVANFELSKELLKSKGLIAEGNGPLRILYIQKSLQQLRAQGSFESVFRDEINAGLVQGVSFTAEPYQDQNSASDIVGEYFRIVVNAQKKDPVRHIGDWYSDLGWDAISKKDWKLAAEVFSGMPIAKKLQLREEMTANVYRMGLNRETLYRGLPSAIFDFVKLVFDEPVKSHATKLSDREAEDMIKGMISEDLYRIIKQDDINKAVEFFGKDGGFKVIAVEDPVKPSINVVRLNYSDGAMTSEVGGIDMNDINVESQGQGATIRFHQEEFQRYLDMPIQGFAPVIINITPLPSILPLLGLAPGKDEDESLELSALATGERS